MRMESPLDTLVLSPNLKQRFEGSMNVLFFKINNILNRFRGVLISCTKYNVLISVGRLSSEAFVRVGRNKRSL